ncbi:hypothetical protein [Arthrobacter sp. SAFR-014]|uniref:hypothetical protein n=1 Tax=unclassified Arthrobacter TaxID=235627 RepID=UPI003F7CA578
MVTNIGTAFFTAGLLALFEPLLRETVRTEATTTASAVATTVTEPLSRRLTSLEQRVAAAVDEEMRSQEEAISTAETTFDYGSVFALMSKALEISALDRQQITVQATDQLGELVLTLAYEESERYYDHERIGTNRFLVLRVDSEAIEEPVEQVWESEEDFSKVVGRLLVDLTKVGAGIRRDVSWGLATDRLARALGLAIRSWRGDGGTLSQLRGRLSEVVADRWYITDKGLSAPSYQLWVEASSWPPIRADGGFGPKRKPAATKPEEADQTEWDYVIARCDGRFAKQLDALGRPLS